MFKRRHFLINPKMQLSTIAIALVLGLASGGFIFLYLQNFFASLKDQLIIEGVGMNSSVFEFLRDQESSLNIVFIFITLWFSLMNSFILLLFTHRVAGPAVRLKRGMQDILDEKLTETIRVRKGDFLDDLASLLDQIREKILNSKSK